MNNKSVIDNPKRLTALLKEKIAYDEYKSDDYSVLHGTLENVARLNRVEILRYRLETEEKRQVSMFFKFIESGEITIETAAKCSGMTVEKFKNRLQEIKNEKNVQKQMMDILYLLLPLTFIKVLKVSNK